MQSGRAKLAHWVLEYDRKAALGPEPLMGWTSSGDTLNQVRLKFDTLEQAVERAEKEGLEYSIIQPHERRIKPKNYTDNFKYKPFVDA